MYRDILYSCLQASIDCSNNRDCDGLMESLPSPFDDKLLHFIQKFHHTFVYNISGTESGFDYFSQWCFGLKHHIPRLNKMKHIILNIHPPDVDRPIEMWHIWNNVQRFCKDLGAYKKIARLEVNFIDRGKGAWAAQDRASWVMGLFDQSDIADCDVGMILTLLSRQCRQTYRQPSRI